MHFMGQNFVQLTTNTHKHLTKKKDTFTPKKREGILGKTLNCAYTIVCLAQNILFKKYHKSPDYFFQISPNLSKLCIDINAAGRACGVMVIVGGNGYGDLSSNLEQDTNTLEKGMHPVILFTTKGK